MVHRQHTGVLPLGGCGLAILVASVAMSCSAGEGSGALQPANASAAPVSRPANGKEILGSGDPASKAISAPAPVGSTAPSELGPEVAFAPLSFAPDADAGVSSTPPAASPDPAVTPASEDDDDDDDDDDDEADDD